MVRSAGLDFRERRFGDKNGVIVDGVIVLQDTDVAKRELKRLLDVAETVVGKLKARTCACSAPSVAIYRAKAMLPSAYASRAQEKDHRGIQAISLRLAL